MVDSIDEIEKRWRSRLQRGFLRIICLRTFATKKELSGNELREYIERITSGKWKPSPGSIYPIISEMESEGLIELVSGDSKKIKIYRVTDLGRLIHKRLILNSHVFGQRADMNFEFLRSDDFEIAIRNKYDEVSLKELKLNYEVHKRITEILGEMLQVRILEDDSID